MNEGEFDISKETKLVPLRKTIYWLGPSGVVFGGVGSPDDRIVDFPGINPDMIPDDFLTSISQPSGGGKAPELGDGGESTSEEASEPNL